jgi:hypothetical protein
VQLIIKDFDHGFFSLNKAMSDSNVSPKCQNFDKRFNERLWLVSETLN